ncbi:MAG TPA: PIG-L family deacetylase [Pyrinomonadaceae bacterium]|jgi:LmbE family N-acetylglucosaminyl deacetylase|nr:PIG-L family deacetylase [Pyrinomonadaceae bacterium]
MKNSNQWSVVSGQRSIVRSVLRVWFALALCALLLIAATASAQQQRFAPPSDVERNPIELYQSLLDLQNPWTVMCVAAHPDDEDGATLTVLRRKYGIHTVTVFSTYGEGGQNAVGPELYEELGAIRARETEEAARIQGSEPFFLGLRDFGFSKSYEEAFRVWGHDEALRRMVLKIRQLRPDVIITNHDTLTGHGHHQATGRLVLEAFDAAADPRRFPEQLRGGLTTWQVQRLFVRFQFEGSGSKAAEEEATRTGKIVSINRNERDAVRGTTYAEQALQALQRHATQGPWPQTIPAGGAPNVRYRLALSAKDSAPLPANAQTFLDGLQLPKNLSDMLTPLAAKAIFYQYTDKPHQSILSQLVNARKGDLFSMPTSTDDEPRFRLMQARLDSALTTASGIKVTFMPSNDVLIPGTTTKVSLIISNDGERTAHVQRINLRGLQSATTLNLPQTIEPGKSITVELQTSTPRTARISVPPAEHLYDGDFSGEELAASATIEIDGATFPVEAAAHLNVAPAIEIASIDPSPLVITPATINRPAAFTLRVINHQDNYFKGEIIATGPTAKATTLRRTLEIADGGTLGELKLARSLHLSATDFGRSSAQHVANAVSFTIAAKNLPGPMTKREVRLIWSDARVVPNLRVGYVKSFDDTLRNALASLGVEAHELTVSNVGLDDLSGYQAIIIDNRGYQAHPELVAANSRLLDYVRAGGTLIVFYHKTNEWNPDPKNNRTQLAPYPITLGNSRVTDENAPIEFTEPNHPLLNFPNKITQEDFAGWIQERGLYYPQSWDSHYSAPFTTSDTGEQPLRGGLLATEYGRGRYIYTSMVWYRQLRAGIPGAYRILANMISYGREGQ